MKIAALHPYDESHLIEITKIAIIKQGVSLRGIYEPIDNCFYLLEGCHRIEAAKRKCLPVVLLNCPISQQINVEIPGLLDIFEQPVFDDNGFATAQNVMQNCNWIGIEYDSSEFVSIVMKQNVSD